VQLVPDLSVWQTGESASNLIDVPTLASVVPGAWVRFTDYSLYARYGADAHYVDTLQQLQQHGCHSSGYLYPRPYLSDPVTQIEHWYGSSPAFTMSPMLDPEGPGMGGMTGSTLTQWIDEALAHMAKLWPQWLPTFYTSRAFCNGYAVSRPSTPHILQLAEYHFGYQPFGWDSVNNWAGHALSAYGGPDLPNGYAGWDVWQFTSSAQVPGVDGSLDMSMVTDEAWLALIGSNSPQPLKEEVDVIKQFLTPDGTVWMVWGIFRAAMTDDKLRHAMMELQLLDPVLTPLEHTWSLTQLRELPLDAFTVKMMGAQQVDLEPSELTDQQLSIYLNRFAAESADRLAARRATARSSLSGFSGGVVSNVHPPTMTTTAPSSLPTAQPKMPGSTYSQPGHEPPDDAA
jgi:hypothetical protein